jgi:glutathione-regulated potassium-efflux system ancillary protein KefC/glutathione-regulated potassium-efflux system protein KefB
LTLLVEALVFLAAALVAVPLARRLGMSSAVGYLLAGVAIGPWGLSLVGDVDATLHFAEVGVVMLLFIIGVELAPRRLWRMRRLVFGLGSLQILATTLLLVPLLVFAAPMGLAPAALFAFAFALSSTAFGLQFLAERRQLASAHGRAAFGVLLFQDIAAIPALAVLAYVAAPDGGPGGGAATWWQLGAVAGVIALAMVARLAMRPLLRAIASTGIRELFTAAALLLVIGAAVAFERAGLSAALGAFVAGVLVAESEYQHQLQTDIEPFKGLLLGLFFIAVGMAADLGLLAERPHVVLGLVAGLILVKAAVLYAVSASVLDDRRERVRLSVTLSQGGEFAFVLLAQAGAAGVVDAVDADVAVLVVTLSMASTPLLAAAVERLLRAGVPPAQPADTIDEHEHAVVIAGFGRFGQIVARVLLTRGIPFTALDSDAAQIELLRRTGNEVYFGDASRLDLLHSAHVERARAFVIAVGSEAASNRIAESVRRHYPDVKVLARALNRQHALALRALGVHYVIRETLLSSMALAGEVLHAVGMPRAEVERTLNRFAAHDADVLERQFAVRTNEGAVLDVSRAALRELSSLFTEDIRIAPADAPGRAAADAGVPGAARSAAAD